MTEYPRITLNVSGTLAKKSRTKDGDAIFQEVFVDHEDEIGEIHISLGMGSGEDVSLLTDEQLHTLFAASGSYKFGKKLIKVHSKVEEFLESEFGIDDLDDISFTLEDYSLTRINGDEERIHDTIRAAANTTENPRQTLLEYATGETQFKNLQFHAENLLHEELEGQTSNLEPTKEDEPEKSES